jgi:hypothetical protein
MLQRMQLSKELKPTFQSAMEDARPTVLCRRRQLVGDNRVAMVALINSEFRDGTMFLLLWTANISALTYTGQIILLSKQRLMAVSRGVVFTMFMDQ